MTDSQFDRLSNRKNIREKFFNEACVIIPTSCFVELMESKQKKCTPLQKCNIPTLFDLAASFKDSCGPELDLEMLNEMFTDSIIYSDKQIQNIYEITRKQSDSQHWPNHRKGRLTASKLKYIYTATKTLKNNNSMAYPNILALLVGYTTPPQTWQMKHGINSDPHAKQKFKQFFKRTL